MSKTNWFMFFIVLSVQFFCYDCFAEISDEYTVRIKSGQPAVLPSVAKVNEEVQFNFSVNLCDKNDKQVEEIPEDEISSINYMLTSYKLTSSSPPPSIYDSFGAIEECHPNLTIASHKKSASKTVQEFYQKVSATTQYPTTGEYKLSLFVTIKFSDNSTCFDIHDINVKVADAILTVYACPPPLRKKDIFKVRHFYGEVGHSFWKIAIDSNLLSPNENLGLPNSPNVKIANNNFGFYPQVGMKNHLIDFITPVDGTVGSDNGHAWYSAISYPITPSDAKDAIAKVVAVNSDQYSVITIGGQNCTSQSSVIAGTADCSPPSGSGPVRYHAFSAQINFPLVKNDVQLWGPGFLWQCPNPYTHAVQIAELNGTTINGDFTPQNDLD